MERLIIFRFPLDKSEAFCYNKVSNFGVWRSPVARVLWEQDTGGDAPAGKRALRAK